MHKKFSAMLLLLIGMLAFSIPTFAQGGGDSSKGSITVEVQDISGGIISNAAVTLSGPAGGRKATTDSRGQVTFAGLAPGSYNVTVENPGFRTYKTENINVSASQNTPVLTQLQPGSVTETVQVSENSTPVDTSSTTTGSTITSEQMANLPVARNVAALFSMAPGASPGLGTDNLATPKESFNPSISGASGLENQYIIDGINTTDQGYGSFGVWSLNYGSLGSGVNFDFVKEVQIKTGGFEASYGQALGGILNIVTDSGGNKIHGSIFAYSSPSWAEGAYRQPNVDGGRISSPTTELLGRHETDFGFNVGGPFIKDKFFWYGGFNPTYTTLARQAPLNFGARALGPQNWDSHNYNFVGKLDYNLTQNHRLEATAFGDPSRDPSSVKGSLLRDDLDSASSLDYGTYNWALKYSGVFATTTLLNASFAWNKSHFDETPTNNTFQIRNYGKPKPNAAYTYEGGLGLLENNETNNKQYNVMVTKNVTFLGGHQFDLGYGFNDISYDAYRLYTGPQFGLPAAKGVAASDVGKIQYGGLFYFYPTRTVAGVSQKNVYREVRGNFSKPNISTAGGYQSSFFQDAWQVNRYVTIKAGVRWEQQQIHGEASRYVFGGNWAPRIGFIVDPTGSRKTKLFANWGRFFEKIPQDLAVRALTAESSYGGYTAFGLPPTTANLVPGSSASPVGVDPTIIFGGTKAQYQEEIVAGVEHELTHGLVVSARFIHRDLKRIIEDTSGITVEQANNGSGQQYVIQNPHLSGDIFHNAVACTSGPNCDTDAGYTLDSGTLGPDGKPDGLPDPRRIYNALELTAEKRFGNNWSLLTNYRLSKLFGNFEGNFRNDNGQSDPNISSLFDFANSPALQDQFRVGVLPADRRHIVNVFGNYMLKGVNIGLGYQSLSGTPVSKFNAHPADGYQNAGEIPVGGRGAFGRTPWQNYFNTHLDYKLPFKSESFRVKLAADIFNIFNRKTVVSIDQNAQLSGYVTNNDFLKPLFYHRPAYARFALRFEF